MMKTILLNNHYHVLTWHQRLSAPFKTLTTYMERKSIKAHLALTEIMMRSVDTTHLTDVQRANRNQVIDLLHTYWNREVFPINVENNGTRLPYIRDERGTLCAMGYLLHETGQQEYVDMLAFTDNHVYIRDVHEGPLVSWLEDYGMSKEEAMRVQPTYGWDPYYTYNEPSIFIQIIQFLPMVLSLVYFIIAMYFTWVLIHALRFTSYKRVLGYFVFTLTNVVVSTMLFLLLEEITYSLRHMF